jgi:hypothetical protein
MIVHRGRSSATIRGHGAHPAEGVDMSDELDLTPDIASAIAPSAFFRD